MTPQPDPEQDIRRVLHALGHAEPSTGMQQRILAALAQTQPSPARRWSPWWTLALGSAVAASLLVMLLPTHRPSVAPAPRAIARASVISQQPTSITPVKLRQPRAHHPAKEITVAQQVSFPPPPEPLTDQERLMIRLIHHNDPVQLAMLSTAAIHATIEQDKNEVREFFAPQNVPPITDVQLNTLPNGAMQ